MLATSLETVASGRKLRVGRLGSGRPLVLLHGYPDNLQIWSELAPRLAGEFDVRAFDWPGMGESEPWPGGATPAHMADRLLSLLDHWRVESLDLVGMDMGGQPALVFASRYPERIRRLVVMNSLVSSDEPTSLEIKILRDFGWNRFLIRNLPRLIFRRAVRSSLPSGQRLPLDVREDFWESFRRPEVRRFISRMCAGYQGTLERLPESYALIGCPTLLLWGERDRHFPPAQARRLHRLLRDSRLEILPEGEHWMAFTRAEEVAERIREFLLDPSAG